MGRVKEELLKSEYKLMEKMPNTNLREYLLTIESVFMPEPCEQDNYYLVSYKLLDLESLKPVTISEKVPEAKLEKSIPNQLLKMIREDNQAITGNFSYNSLINGGWLGGQYLFEAIPLKRSISSLNDLLIIPSSEKAMIYHLSQINYNLSLIGGVIDEMESTNTHLENIKGELDLMNYLAQG